MHIALHGFWEVPHIDTMPLFRPDSKLGKYRYAYVQQTLYATLFVFILLAALNVQEMVIISSLGASSFIVFAMPRSPVASPRHLVGGHLLGLLAGGAFSLLPTPTLWHRAAFYALSVGLTMALMVVTDSEHPPAAGTALSVMLNGFTTRTVLSVLASVGALALVYVLFGDKFVDLV